MEKKRTFLTIVFMVIFITSYSQAISICKEEESVPLFKPKGWGKVIPNSEGQIIYCKEPGKEFRGKIILKGLGANHHYKLSINDKKRPSPGSGKLPYPFNDETFFDFQDIKTDQQGNCEKQFTTKDERLPDGKYDVKFFVKDWESEGKPIVLYNDNIFFTIKK